jgi:hypothetical protein
MGRVYKNCETTILRFIQNFTEIPIWISLDLETGQYFKILSIRFSYHEEIILTINVLGQCNENQNIIFIMGTNVDYILQNQLLLNQRHQISFFPVNWGWCYNYQLILT